MAKLARVLEPEVMDSETDAWEYDQMDHSEVNRKFVSDFLEVGFVGTDILDLGTGTARIPVELCRHLPNIRVMASDAATAMLDLARYHIEAEGLVSRVQLHHGDAKRLSFPDAYFDAVISNSLIHHLPQPMDAIVEVVRVLKPDGRVFLRDLCRPDDDVQLEQLVERYCGNETDYSKQLFRQSLHAALNLDEIREMVQTLGFSSESVQMTSDRHWTWCAVKT